MSPHSGLRAPPMTHEVHAEPTSISQRIDDFINNRTLRDLIKYVIVGGGAFLIDYAVLYMIVTLGGHYITATLMGFAAGVTTNYLLCLKWVWKGSQATTFKDIFIFTAIGVAGLGVTVLLMWLSVDILSIDARIAKIYTAALVLIWNFTLRKIFVFFH